ncbi:MAG TPA: hypothetical protein VK563_19780 [Puia sp.]|nr:hypothetical protein [Puia sp.]
MDSQKIQSAFPGKLRTDVRTVISVLPFKSKVLLNDGQTVDTSVLIHQQTQEVTLDGEKLLIPTRIYFNEPYSYEEKTLSDLQKVILNCIYLRHHDGHVRQKRLNTLISKNYYFTVPYTFQLLGEYVIEIINDLDDFIDETNIHLFRRFVSENLGYSTLTKNRVISYWNEYYRFGERKDIRNYVGRRIFERLENE